MDSVTEYLKLFTSQCPETSRCLLPAIGGINLAPLVYLWPFGELYTHLILKMNRNDLFLQARIFCQYLLAGKWVYIREGINGYTSCSLLTSLPPTGIRTSGLYWEYSPSPERHKERPPCLSLRIWLFYKEPQPQPSVSGAGAIASLCL